MNTDTTNIPISNVPTVQTQSLKVKKYRPKYIIPLIISIILILAIIPTSFFAFTKIENIVCENFNTDSNFYKSFNCLNRNNSTNTSRTSSNNTSFNQGNTIQLDKNLVNNQEDLVTQIVQNTSPAVVTIAASSQLSSIDNTDPTTNLQSQNQNIGSGFIVRQEGLIVTNSHVVEDQTLDYSVVLSTDKNPIPIKNIYRDSQDDIAIIKIDKTNLPTLKLGNSDNVKVGNTVVAIGSPLGEYTGTVTQGIISGLNRNLTAGGSSGSTKSYQGVFQTDAAINPGNSGGPLLNSNAEVIGVNFATTLSAENISFALPINRVKTKLSEFQTYGKLLQPYLGISYTQRAFYLTNGTLNGAIINQVQANSPAQTAGILKGDIILKVNDKDLASNSLLDIIQQSKIGDKLNLSVWRKGQTISITITVGDSSK